MSHYKRILGTNRSSTGGPIPLDSITLGVAACYAGERFLTVLTSAVTTGILDVPASRVSGRFAQAPHSVAVDDVIAAVTDSEFAAGEFELTAKALVSLFTPPSAQLLVGQEVRDRLAHFVTLVVNQIFAEAAGCLRTSASAAVAFKSVDLGAGGESRLNEDQP